MAGEGGVASGLAILRNTRIRERRTVAAGEGARAWVLVGSQRDLRCRPPMVGGRSWLISRTRRCQNLEITSCLFLVNTQGECSLMPMTGNFKGMGTENIYTRRAERCRLVLRQGGAPPLEIVVPPHH